MTAYALYTALKRVPRGVWLLVLAGLALWSAVAAVRSYGAAQYALGKASATQGVSFDSTMQARAAAVVALRTAHTDTVWLRAKASANKAVAAVVALPDSLRPVPEVAQLVSTTYELTAQVDTLTTAITAERAAWSEKAKVDSAAIYALRVIGTARADTIADLSKRPTRKKAALYALLGVGAGFLGGVAR